MRPPITDTPPISHMVPHNACAQMFNWSTLTSDTSIQILHLGGAEQLPHPEAVAMFNKMKGEGYRVSNEMNDNDVNKARAVQSSSDPSPVKGVDRRHESISKTTRAPSFKDTLKRPASTCNSAQDRTATQANLLTSERPPLPYVDAHASKLHEAFTVSVQDANGPAANKCTKLNRNMYSDSDIICGCPTATRQRVREINVARSKSLGYTDTTRSHERGLLRPLRPCAYKSKVGNVKRLSSVSFKASTKPAVPSVPENNYNDVNVDKNTVNMNKDLKAMEQKEVTEVFRKPAVNISLKHTQSARLPSLFDHQKNRISKFVRIGLKTIINSSKGTFEVPRAKAVAEDSERQSKVAEKKTAPAKDRKVRRTRKVTDIGGLSEFLRKNERRKTLASFPETEVVAQSHSDDDRHSAIATIGETSDYANTADAVNSMISKGTRSLKYTPKLWTGIPLSTKILSTATTNLKFAKCNRKLIFANEIAEAKRNHRDAHTKDTECLASTTPQPNTGTTTTNEIHADTEPVWQMREMSSHMRNSVRGEGDGETSMGIAYSTSKPAMGQSARRPRLGLLGLSKPVTMTTVEIDDLDMDIVRDLKRRVEKANQISKIKTNGSLKASRLGQLNKQTTCIYSPRRSVQGSRSQRLYGAGSNCATRLGCLPVVDVSKESAI